MGVVCWMQAQGLAVKQFGQWVPASITELVTDRDELMGKSAWRSEDQALDRIRTETLPAEFRGNETERQTHAAWLTRLVYAHSRVGSQNIALQ